MNVLSTKDEDIIKQSGVTILTEQHPHAMASSITTSKKRIAVLFHDMSLDLFPKEKTSSNNLVSILL